MTYAVDMNGQDVSRGVYLTGDIVDWNIVAMTNDIDDNYSYSTEADPGDEGAYYYLTTNTWGNYQDFRETVPAECADWYDSDRGFVIGEQNMTLGYRWGACKLFDYELATDLDELSHQAFYN